MHHVRDAAGSVIMSTTCPVHARELQSRIDAAHSAPLVEYVNPLAPERANPFNNVHRNGYLTVDSTSKKE